MIKKNNKHLHDKCHLERVVVRGAGRLLVVADVLEVLLPDEGAHCCTVLYCTVLYCTVLYLPDEGAHRAPPGRHVGGAVGGVRVLGTRLVHQDVNLGSAVLSVF